MVSFFHENEVDKCNAFIFTNFSFAFADPEMIPMNEIVPTEVSKEPNGNTLNVESNGGSKGNSRRGSGSEPG